MHMKQLLLNALHRLLRLPTDATELTDATANSPLTAPKANSPFIDTADQAALMASAEKAALVDRTAW